MTVFFYLKGELDIVMVITAFGVFVYSTFTIIAGLWFENKLACFRHTSFFWLSLGTLTVGGRISKVDLLVPTTLGQLIFILKVL